MENGQKFEKLWSSSKAQENLRAIYGPIAVKLLRSSATFELSNVANGQKFEKLLSLNEAQENLWAIYGPIAVKLLMDVSTYQKPTYVINDKCH